MKTHTESIATAAVLLRELNAKLARRKTVSPSTMRKLRQLMPVMAEFRALLADPDDAAADVAAFLVPDDGPVSEADIASMADARIRQHLRRELGEAFNRITGRVD
jgi:hypothetical protein